MLRNDEYNKIHNILKNVLLHDLIRFTQVDQSDGD